MFWNCAQLTLAFERAKLVDRNDTEVRKRRVDMFVVIFKLNMVRKHSCQQELIEVYREEIQEQMTTVMGNKLGLGKLEKEQEGLVTDLYSLLQKHNVDYTKFFRALSSIDPNEAVIILNFFFGERGGLNVFIYICDLWTPLNFTLYAKSW